jgi:uncharacterized protein YndB with AHSA1/START domain
MAASDAKMGKSSNAEELDLVITRVFDAPRELVFDAWTKAEHLQHWQGAPRGFTVTTEKSDIRPGGGFRICMRSPEGLDHWLQGLYREVARPERLVFTHAWLDATGKANQETLVTVTFVERGGKTEMTLRQSGFKSAESRDGHRLGWTSAFDALGDYLAGIKGAHNGPTAREGGAAGARWPKKGELTIERVFDAPRELVFEAWSKPEHKAEWWGPRGFTLPICEMEFRPGGNFRFVMRGPDGKDYPFEGTYLEIVEPERIVFQGIIHDEPGHQVWTTVTFADHEGKTKLTVRQTYSFESEATRGAPEGWRQTLDRFGEYLARV